MENIKKCIFFFLKRITLKVLIYIFHCKTTVVVTRAVKRIYIAPNNERIKSFYSEKFQGIILHHTRTKQNAGFKISRQVLTDM